MGILANENAISSGGYNIANSLRFQSASSTYLARTPASAGNRQKFTFSFWAKRGTLSAAQEMYFVNSGGGNFSQISWTSGNAITITSVDSSVASCELVTTPVYRDPSAWYHLVISVDTTQATASNRVKIYVNGSQVTALSTAAYPSLNYNFQLNNTTAQNIGRPSTATFDGYLAEFNFVDGQQYDPSYFGETNTLTGQWVAKKYTGTYGTNGFYLPFSNGTSTTTLGADSSGNGNNWTLTNFTRSAGVSDCWMYDVPSGNGYAGTQPSSNYAVLNPLNVTLGGSTVSAANLKVVLGATGQWRITPSTMAMPTSGKYYFEVTAGTNAGSAHGIVGIISTTDNFNVTGGVYLGQTAGGYGYLSDGQKLNNNTSAAYGASWTANDVIGVAYDADTGALVFYKNGTSQGTAYTVTSGASYYAAVAGDGQLPTFNFNAGQRSFAYTPPTGFKALCTANLPASTIVKGNQYMDATLYTGNGSTQTITNAAGFSPDLVWIKIRSTTGSNVLSDVVRGTNSQLFSNLTDAEQTRSDYITAFNSNGFSLGAGSAGTGNVNSNGATFVGWQWDAGSSTVTNTSGTISSQVRANPTAGFSIVTYTGTGANATVGHGLGVAPAMIICKSRSNANGWIVWHKSLASGASYLNLETTAAVASEATLFQSTTPNSTVITLGTNLNVNRSAGSQLIYAFAEIAGFSKFGSYTGNGSTDGPFVYTGFRPKFVMTKSSTAVGGWIIFDTSRNTYNVVGNELYPNSSAAEGTGYTDMDILSNGFKLRVTADPNASGQTYIYMAFAESPFANSNSR